MAFITAIVNQGAEYLFNPVDKKDYEIKHPWQRRLHD